MSEPELYKRCISSNFSNCSKEELQAAKKMYEAIIKHLPNMIDEVNMPALESIAEQQEKEEQKQEQEQEQERKKVATDSGTVVPRLAPRLPKPKKKKMVRPPQPCYICGQVVKHPYAKSHINSKRHIKFLLERDLQSKNLSGA